MWLDTLRVFAQVNVGDFINNGATTAKTITDSWNNQWVDLLQNNTNTNLYGALTNLGIFFAVGTLLFFMIRWLRDAIYAESSSPLSDLIWPFIVVALLANPGNGTVLSDLTLGVRNYINTINQQVVKAGDIDQNYQQALNLSIAEEVAGSFLRPCQALTGDQQTECFVKAKEKIDPLWVEYRNLYGNKTWIDRLETKVNQITENTGTVSEVSFNALLGSTVQTSIKSFLISLQFAFQNLIEATMLLIAALGPLAIGGSLLPVAGKPIFAWLTGFLSLGIAKISFNIIAVLTATVIVNGPAQDANADPDLMWYIIFLSVLAPILSLLVATAAGFAVFNAISNTTSWVRERV
ncbi:hypothetical protein G7B40_024070 [Aetokthonos hydrillicola Thurmond2011]|jgi:hypothetical protein|uniref:Uncharacterized protein n=1 Tax=Aetokthonos hydrillicola Thurmond2011 TaxID=2712845 RepID=A0AAP5M9W1_9CYAN|nr:hypothetical protein [Aetokthonos hydrillicola]MBO3461136.1 hypothetical protein [Aetokthonos hydrillicola CCALA 1050]MBW4586905.1 hypothetical protein [Aetokthonos hydrillicola CCALA 1050]MDR9897620.1 hypothetical protein [Aetokthonos hydrillicola Thurmond2011]